VIELTAAFAFYYYWDRLPPKTHAVIGGIYALAAWISLVLITGITAFMLNIDGLLGNWNETHDFWHAFINVQWLPQTIMRTGAALVFGILYVYAHAAVVLQNDEMTRIQVVQRMNKPFLCGLILVLAGFVGWFVNLPEISRVILERSAALNVLSGFFVASIMLIFVLMLLGPMRDPKTLNGGFAVCLFLFGVTALATGEFVREAVRKPYIVDRVVLGNQILVADVERLQKTGLLENGYWTSLALQKEYPELWHNVSTADISGNALAENIDHFDESALLHYPKEKRLLAGRMIFMYHCNNCHAAEHGLSALGPLVYGESQRSLVQTVKNLNNVLGMPPWCGNDAEANLLAEYLQTLTKNEEREEEKSENL